MLGFVHSDVKPNNILFDLYSDVEDLYKVDHNQNIRINEKANVFLLDFGLSERYLNKDRSHAKMGKIERLLGNKFFMSLSQLQKNGIQCII